MGRGLEAPAVPGLESRAPPWAFRTHPEVSRNTDEDREMLGELRAINNRKEFVRKPLLPLVAFVVVAAAAVAQAVAPSPSRPSH